MRRSGRGLVLLAVLAVAAGCATPALGYQDYETKTKDTAKALVGVASSARLGASAWLDGNATMAFADTLVTHTEDNCGSISTTYGSRQPPDDRSLALRKQADPAIQQTCSTIGDLRIALRRADHDAVRQALDDLEKSVKPLESLQEQLP